MTDPQISIKISANSDGVAAALDEATEHIQRAQQAAELAAEVLGVKVPAALQEILAESAVVGPALEAAFPVLAVGEFLEVLGNAFRAAEQAAKSIGELSNEEKKALQGATTEAKTHLNVQEQQIRAAYELAAANATNDVEKQEIRVREAAALVQISREYEKELKQQKKNLDDLIQGQRTYAGDLHESAKASDYDIEAGGDIAAAYSVVFKKKADVLENSKEYKSLVSEIALAEAHVTSETAKGIEAQKRYTTTIAERQNKLDELMSHVGQTIRREAEQTAQAQQDLIQRTNVQAFHAYEQENSAEIQANERKLQAERQDTAAYYEGQIAVARNAEKQMEALLQLELRQHKITRNEEIKATEEGKLWEFATEERYLNELQGLYDKGSKDWERVQTRITTVQQQQSAIRAKIAAGEEQTFKTQVRKQLQDWQQVNLELAHTFTGTLQGMNSSLAAFIVTGQANFRQLVTSAIEQFVQMGLQYSESLLLMKLFGESARQSQTDDVLTGAIAQINAQAQVAGANVYAEWAWNPPVALAMSADAIATVGAMAAAAGAGIGKFELGGVVPMTGLALLHKGEKVIPANMSGTGQGIGTDGLHVHFHVHAVDGQDGANFINRQMGNITNNLVKHLKKRGFFSH